MVNTRNAVYNEAGTIDCEIEHPQLGWIPFTADPEDVAEHGRQLYEALSKELGPQKKEKPQ